MARFVKAEAPPNSAEDQGGERTAAALDADGSRGDAAIQGLPGVVNDLPEVAPHEWIYIMS